MEHYRTTSHSRFDIKLHFVWVTKYRKPMLTGAVSHRLRDIIRQICAEHEVEIIKGHVSKDHVHLFVSVPPRMSPSGFMQKVKGKSSRKLQMEFRHLKKAFWGRHVWARGYFVASSGNVTDEVIMEYIKTQNVEKEDEDFKVEP